MTLVLIACGPDGARHEDRSSPRSQFDSEMGTLVIENSAPLWRLGEEWQVDTVPTVAIGAVSGGHGPDLMRVGDIVPLSDGRIVVQNSGTSELLLYDSSGMFLQAVGRPGRGPGELSGMLRLFRCGGDTLLVTEANAISVFSPSGHFVRSHRVSWSPGYDRHEIGGVAADCSIGLTVYREPRAPGTSVYYHRYVFSRESGTRAKSNIGSFAGPDLVPLSGPWAINPVPQPFGREDLWTVTGDQMVIVPSDTAELRTWGDAGKLTRVVRWNARPEPVGEADRERFARESEEFLRLNPEEAPLFPPLEQLSPPTHKPLFSRVLADDEQTLWIREYPVSAAGRPWLRRPREGDPPEEWTVIDSTGRWLGVVRIPGGVEVKAIQARRILGIARDADDVEEVRVYRIIRE